MVADSAAVQAEVEEGVATVWLNRPERLNAWGGDLAKELVEVLRSLEADDRVSGVILTGRGRAFSAGADLKSPKTHRIESIEEHLEASSGRGPGIFDLVSAYDKPIMAAVNGYAIGIGCLVTLCCDFVYASESARFQLPQVTLGILPAYGGSLRLARAVGKLNAGEMMLTGRMIEADEARTWGIVSRVFPDADLVSVSQEAMRTIGGKPKFAVKFARESLRAALDANNMHATELADEARFMILAQMRETAQRHEAWRQRERP